MNWFGFLVGLVTLCIISLGFFWVMRGERHFGYLWWPHELGMGILCVLCSLVLSNDWMSALLGAFGATFIWGSTELRAQAIQGELGWYAFQDGKIRPPCADIIKKWKAPSL